VECKANSPCAPFLVAIYAELKNPIESAVVLNNVRGVIRGGERLALWGRLCRACARHPQSVEAVLVGVLFHSKY